MKEVYEIRLSYRGELVGERYEVYKQKRIGWYKMWCFIGAFNDKEKAIEMIDKLANGVTRIEKDVPDGNR